ncbi:MAG: O-linked N-acetylglucosamine transferase, SPINDLY family protein [Planctomycetota bacterium]|jgi:predicted O-linked N-acetylglucosamine transferase (SPINDLY family)
MSRDEKSQLSGAQNELIEQSTCAEQTPQNKNNRLQFSILADDTLSLVFSKKGFPDSLIKAYQAAQTGEFGSAAALLDDQTIEDATKVFEKDPSRTDIMFILANTLEKIGRLQKAENLCQKLLKQEPCTLVYYELSEICKKPEQLSDRAEYLKKAIAACREESKYQLTLVVKLAHNMMNTDQVQEGIDLMRKAVEKMPKSASAHSSLLFDLHFLPELDIKMLFDKHTEWGRVYASPDMAKSLHENVPDPDRRLRIGYISPDFKRHSVTYFFEPLLDEHNRQQMEIYGYGNVTSPDDATERLKLKFDHYRNILGLNTEEVTRMIERDEIDILVDLAGHTNGNRLLVMARKPAPIQVTYLGYVNTLGMEQIDYFLTDELASPPNLQKYYVEELIYLPDGYFCYKPPDFAPPVASLPVGRKGYVTFGVFCNNARINPVIMKIWADVLKTVPDSRILMKFRAGDDQQVRDRYFRRFESFGIDPDRVEICGLKGSIDVFQHHNEVDIMLGTYPLSGFTGTFHALWMGVPTITLVGEHRLSRLGLSILSRVGLEFFTASTPDEYVAKAVALAANTEALAEIRATMRQRMTASSICDAKRFTQNVEAAYRKMWQKWCRNQPDKRTLNCARSRLSIGQDGQPQLSIVEQNFPQFLIKACHAAQNGQFDKATALLDEQAVKTAVKIFEADPARTDVMLVLAKTLHKISRLEKAENFYRKIVDKEPFVYSELANICKKTHRVTERIEYLKKAIQVCTNESKYQANLTFNLVHAMMNADRVQEGIDLMRKTLEKMPECVSGHSQLLFDLHFLPELDNRMLFEEHKKWGRIYAPPNLARKSHDNIPDPDRRLRIGYISPDLRRHSVTYFFEPLLDGHNRQQVEIYGYGNVTSLDQVTERLKRKFDHYRNILGADTEKVTRIIEQDKIDILVDLAGHTTGNRLLVMARKPAPIQATCLGNISTVGMEQIDYFLTDEMASPPQLQQFFVEELVFLPDGYFCYRPPEVALPVGPLPAIRNGYITFGAFCNNARINSVIMKIWADVLKTNPGSRILLRFRAGDDQQVRDRYLRQFEALGVCSDRVRICAAKDIVDILEHHSEIDIMLSTYPFNNFSGIFHAMWMGVPTISLTGEHRASRLGLSILSRVGLEILAAATPDEYVAKATALATSKEALARIRTTMRQRMAASPICDAKRFAHNLEVAYRKMWHKWCLSHHTEAPKKQNKQISDVPATA